MDANTSYQTLSSNSIRYMLKFVGEYESVKKGEHAEFTFVKNLFEARGFCSQNFHKFYRRYKASGFNPESLLPQKRGSRGKYLDLPNCDNELVLKVLEYRKSGLNKFIIASALAKDKTIKNPCSASTIYRILSKYGVSKLKLPMREEKRKIVREKAGELLHIDCHYLEKGIVKEFPQKRFYALGGIDDYSRVAWVEVLESTKAIDATFGMMDIILGLHKKYDIQCKEVMTDNGSEFCGKMESHPYERLLQHFGIKHLRTKPYRPQTNGKIERFWRTFDEEVMEGCEFETLDELKDSVLGYVFYYNESRPHQGIDGKTPLAKLTM
jgi:transposase InsO family protein